MEIWLVLTGWIEKGVLGFLLLLSIWSVAIMIDRKRAMRTVGSSGDQDSFRALISSGKFDDLEKGVRERQGLKAGALQAALAVARTDSAAVDRSVRSFLTEERLRLERGLPVLATLGSNAPFIGLFGTVLGIIQAFAALGGQQGDASTVMAGISRALYATAAGLFVAIPAVMAFNHFSNRIRKAVAECESLKDFYLARFGGGKE